MNPGLRITEASATDIPLPPSSFALFRIWLTIGLQSFGGGSATLALIRKAFVDASGLITPIEFSRDWGLVQIAPGINLFAMTILIGRRLRGARGIVVSLAGLLIPSVAATILFTALYKYVENVPWVRAAIRGIIPASVGIGIALGMQMLAPVTEAARKEGPAPLACCIAILIAAVVAEQLFASAVIPILVAGGFIGACEAAIRFASQREPQ